VSNTRPSKIAIVDDNDGVSDSTRALLESHGLQIETFPSAEALLESALAACVDCLLVDIQMPGLGGVELLEQLRASGVHTPAILMTANVEHIGARAAQVGALTVLRKPFGEEELLNWIRPTCRLDAPLE
jgi:FixJ family two-component response regulator